MMAEMAIIVICILTAAIVIIELFEGD